MVKTVRKIAIIASVMLAIVYISSALALAQARWIPLEEMEERLTQRIRETSLECRTDIDCREVFCPQVVGMDTPQCRNGKCVCGPGRSANLTKIKYEIINECLQYREMIRERLDAPVINEEELMEIRKRYKECLPQPFPIEEGRIVEIVRKYALEKRNLTASFVNAIRELNELKVEIALNSNLTGRELAEKIKEINEQRRQLVKDYVEKLKEINLARQTELKEVLNEIKVGRDVEIDGTKVNITKVTINVNGKEIEIRPGDNVTIIIEGVAVRSKVRLRVRENRLEDEELNKTINVTPEIVRERVRERIRETVLERRGNTLVYSVNAERTGRLLGLIPVNLQLRYEISAENGELISVNRPWWSFLVLG